MATNLDETRSLKRLSELYAQAKDLLERKAYYAALTRYSEIFALLSELKEPQRRLWQMRMTKTKLNSHEVRAVKAGAVETYGRIEKILSIGDQFLDDELLLVLTFRLQLGMLEVFMRQQHGLNLRLCWEEIDSKLMRLKSSAANSPAYKIASNQIKRNWHLPRSVAMNPILNDVPKKSQSKLLKRKKKSIADDEGTK